MKISLKGLAIDLIVFVAFNLLFFLTDAGKNGTAVWISYGAITFANFCMIATRFFDSNDREARLSSLPVYAITVIHLVVTFLVGMVFIYIRPYDYKAAQIFHIVITAIYLAVLVIQLMENDRTAEAQKIHDEERRFIKTATKIVDDVIAKNSDAEISQMLDDLRANLQLMPKHSSKKAENFEERIIHSLCLLKSDVISNNKENAKNKIAEIKKNIRLREQANKG